MNKTDIEIAALIRSQRKNKNMTQQQAADLAGLHQRHYQAFEGCSRSLITASFTTTMAVLDALEINPDSFVSSYVVGYKKPDK